jgi:hypothetical protein
MRPDFVKGSPDNDWEVFFDDENKMDSCPSLKRITCRLRTLANQTTCTSPHATQLESKPLPNGDGDDDVIKWYSKVSKLCSRLVRHRPSFPSFPP